MAAPAAALLPALIGAAVRKPRKKRGRPRRKR